MPLGRMAYEATPEPRSSMREGPDCEAPQTIGCYLWDEAEPHAKEAAGIPDR